MDAHHTDTVEQANAHHGQHLPPRDKESTAQLPMHIKLYLFGFNETSPESWRTNAESSRKPILYVYLLLRRLLQGEEKHSTHFKLTLSDLPQNIANQFT